MQTTTKLHSKKFFLRAVFLLIFACNGVTVFSQISAEKASFTTRTEYNPGTSAGQDEIYVFCGAATGELKAVSPDGTDGWTFTWTKWDAVSSAFVTPVAIESGVAVSVQVNLADGLYKVVVTKGTTTEEDQAWVLNNSNSKPVFTLEKLDCVGVHFSSSFVPKNLQYNDISSGGTLRDVPVADETFVFSLTRSNQEVQRSSFLNYDGTTKSFIDQDAFVGDKSYAMSVVDGYGCEFVSDPVVSNTYAVKAEFTVDPGKGEAPLEVAFANKSINATDYEWYVYQDFKRIKDAVRVEDSLLVDGVVVEKDLLPYTYMHPGTYFVKLIVTSDKGPDVCSDEYFLKTVNKPIVVDTSLVQVPNVFTPNGDGKNDLFRVKSQSLKSFHAIVFNRWGRIVYEWKDAKNGGWNGKVNGKWATPGTYFYVITAVGREEDTKKYTKKGSFMLIRK